MLVSVQFQSAINLFLGGNFEEYWKWTLPKADLWNFKGSKRNPIWMDIRFSFTYYIQIGTVNFIKCWKKDLDTKRWNDSVKEKYDFDKKPSADNKFEEQLSWAY